MSRPARFALLTFVGFLLAQAAWMLAVPPFRAIDEFDHVYRAAGVAAGDWRLTEPAQNGRGHVVTVPVDIVEAASAQCASLSYTGRDNCFPIERLDGGMATVATATGPYHPAYYWVTGTFAEPFEGAAADYAMRILSALVCAIGVAFAAYCLSLRGAGAWTKLGFVVSLTPVLIYTTVIPAPNSWEIVSGLCVWVAVLALAGLSPGDPQGGRLVAAAAVAGCVVVTPRALGPMWLLLIVLVLVLYLGRDGTMRVLNQARGAVVIAALAVLAATAGALWWSVSLGWIPSGDEPSRPVAPDADVAMNPPKWILEIVGAFPYRDQPAPLPVYVLYLLVVVTLLWLGIRHGRARERVAVLAAVVLTLLVPITLTLLTAETSGAIWQGRYGLPFIVGVPVLCGLILDRTGWAPVERTKLLPIALTMIGIGQIWSVANVAHAESVRPVSVADSSWITLPPPFVGLVMAVGYALLALAPLRNVHSLSERRIQAGALR